MSKKTKVAALLGLALGMWALGSLFAAQTLNVTRLRCEYRKDPLGIDETKPRLSWVIEAGAVGQQARGVKQSAYRVLVASSAELLKQHKGDLWDSGKVSSDQSIHVEYLGQPLVSEIRCYWKVRVWGEKGRASDWSEASLWSLGLLEPADWKGKWIGLDTGRPNGNPWPQGARWIWYAAGNPAQGVPVATRYFRRTFTLPLDRHVRKAVWMMMADGTFKLDVNGKQREGGDRSMQPVERDVTPFLHGGKNVMAVSATNESRFRTEHKPAGLIGALRVDFAAGEPLIIVTDGHWRASPEAPAGWGGTDWDDAGWPAAMELGAYGMGPWGQVVEAGKESEQRRLPGRMLRRGFDVAKDVVRATAYVCGLGLFELYLNGRRVGDHVMDPTQSRYDKRAMYVTFDATEYLRRGRNAAGVILGNGRFFAPRLRTPTATPTFGYPKLLFQMRIDYGDGTSDVLVSDEHWKVTDQGPIQANNEFDGEEYDASREQDGWDQAGFDDEAWQPVQVVSPPGGKLIAQMAEPMRVTEVLRPVAVRNPKPGVYVADFGQNFYGMVRLRVKGPRDTRVQLRTAFDIHPDGTVDMAPNRGALSTDVYVLKGQGVETWAPRFRGQGTRYAEITGWPGVPTKDDVEFLVIHTDMEKVGDFACSNELVNQIYANVVRSVRMQERGVPMDTDRDERQGWLSVSEKTSETEGYIYDVAAFYSSFLGECRVDQTADGNLSDSGSFWPFHSGDPIWPAVVTTVPWSSYLMYGDRRILERNYPMMKRWLQFQENRLDADLIHRRGNYGDWVDAYSMDGRTADQGGTSRPLMWTAYTYYNCRLVARVADLLGLADDKKHFLDLAERIRTAFNQQFFDPETLSYESRTQTSYVLPLAFGLLSPEHRQGLIDNLVQDILVEHKGHLSVGCVGTKWLMQTLTEIGRTDVAYTILTQTTRPGWGYMVAKGGTSIWERWDGDTRDPGMNGQSQTILAGYLGAWIYQALGGINYDPRQPGFQRIILRPRPVADLTFVRASHRSMYGMIVSDWKIDGDVFRWNVTVPLNTTATVYVPAVAAAGVTESGKPAAKAEGVRFLRVEDSAAVYEVGSGQYRFSSRR